jgi:hypothetical protein
MCAKVYSLNRNQMFIIHFVEKMDKQKERKIHIEAS